MKVLVQDYFGNDVILLDYKQTLVSVSDNTISVIEEISIVNGYSVVDTDNDVVIVQCQDVVDDYFTMKGILIEIINRLNKHFL